jgi:uncharacterized membrane protein
MELTLLHPKIVHLPIALAVIIPLLILAIWIVRSSGGFPKHGIAPFSWTAIS